MRRRCMVGTSVRRCAADNFYRRRAADKNCGATRNSENVGVAQLIKLRGAVRLKGVTELRD